MNALATTSSNVWQWAKLKFDPSEPRTSNPAWQAQHGALVVFTDGQEHRIYFNPGTWSQLRRGDTVLCHYRRGKWRLAVEQPPELIQKLEQRSLVPVATQVESSPSIAPVPQPPPVHAALPTQVAPMPTPVPPIQAKQPTSRDVVEIVDIFQELKAALPEAQETTIRAFSSTLFMQRRKEDAEF